MLNQRQLHLHFLDNFTCRTYERHNAKADAEGTTHFRKDLLVASAHVLRRRLARRKTGEEATTLADDQHFRRLFAAHVANAAHKPCDPDRTVENTL